MADEPPLAVALSGGGHRASLLALGGLLALVDRGLNKRIDVVSSVSGGSITNGVVAHKTDLKALDPQGLDEIARTLTEKIGNRDLYSASAMVFAFVLNTVAPVLIVREFVTDALWASVLVVFVMLSTFLFVSGELLRSALALAYFGKEKATTLGELAERPIAHEFCATDLVTGMPVTFSTRGSLARRRVPVPPSQRGVACQNWIVASLGIDVVIRASAAFPGIAPKRIRFRPGEQQALPTIRLDGGAITQEGDLGSLALCGDGGIWNNLGTQAIREEGGEDDVPVLCINASAPARQSSATLLQTPLVALVMWLYRTMSVLNRNSVEPRVAAVERDLARRHRTRVAPGPGDPLTVVADMRRTDAMRLAMRSLASPVAEPVPAGHPRPDVAGDELDRLVATDWWSSLTALDTDAEIRTKTTLTRIKGEEARLLLVRGYANTWMASLLVKPFDASDEVDTRIASRLCEFTKTTATPA